MNNTSTPREPTIGPDGSRDGAGSGDHDTPYVFGRRPRAISPFPFTTLEYGRLVVLRGRVQDRLACGDHPDDDVLADDATWRPAAA